MDFAKMDFTLQTYQKLLEAIKEANYSVQTVKSFLTNPEKKVVILRHDVDEIPNNALKMATVENKLGVQSTYYFRIVKISNDPEIIKKIISLGHEIGYHYEDFAICNGDYEQAIKSFESNLKYFREFYPVKTICMHGSSMSNYDNRDIWKKITLEDFDLLGEPYMSIDYSDVLYLTDTGRRWDGSDYSVRDFVKSSYNLRFRTTFDIMNAFKQNQLPDKVLLQSHTLWTDSKRQWYWLSYREKVRNNIKRSVLKIPLLRKLTYLLIKLYSK